MRTTLRISAAVLSLLLASCTEKPTLAWLVLTPQNARVARGESQRFAAAGLYTDGSTRVLTDQVAWSVDDAFVATVDASGPAGTVLGHEAGVTKVRARLDGIAAVRELTVHASLVRRLELSPAQPTLPVGLTLQLRATAVQTDLTTVEVTQGVVWSLSGASGVVSLDAARPGLLTALTPGEVEIVGSYQDVAAHVRVIVTAATVSALDVAPTSATLPRGTSRQFIAQATLSDGATLDVTDAATWVSADSAVAFVSTLAGEKGRVFARTPGSTTITVSLDGHSVAVAVTVTAATLQELQVSAPVGVIASGTRLALSATGIYSDGSTADVTASSDWTSSDAASATVSTTGLVAGLAPGSVIIRATFDGHQATCALTVTAATLQSLAITPSPPVLAVGTHLSLVATGTFTDGTTQPMTDQVLWTVGDDTVATVSNLPGLKGQVQAAHVGATTVSAALGAVEVVVPLTVSQALLTRLSVTPIDPQLPLGLSVGLTAMGTFTDGTTQDLTDQATWASTDQSKAAVSNAAGTRGQVAALALGPATITASLGGVQGSSVVTVTSAQLRSITLTPQPLSLPLGTVVQLTATGIYTDASTQNLTALATWASSDAAIVSVSNAQGGRVAAMGVGSTRISAAFSGVVGAANVAVTAAVLTGLEVSPSAVSLPAGLTQQLTATGTYSDSTTRDVTAQVTWTSTAAAVLSVSNAAGSHGLARAGSPGTALIHAQLGTTLATVPATVSPARLDSITLAPASLTLPTGTRSSFGAVGRFSDGTQQNLTAQATWSSSDDTIATVSGGQVLARAEGSVALTAQLGGVSGTASVTVSAAVLTGFELTPASVSTPLGTFVELVATGRYSDGSARDVTTQATWESSDASVASVSPSAGHAVALAVGSCDVRASFGGRSATSSFTVTPAALAAIELTPGTARIAKLTWIPFTATGRWTDGSTADLTATALWSSSDATVATVSNAPGTRARAMGLAPGVVTVSATSGGVTGTTPLTVADITLAALEVTPSLPTAPAGFTRQLTATGVFSDGTTQDLTQQVVWASVDPSVADVDASGLASARVTGTTTLSATALGQTGTVTFTVSAALLSRLDVSPAAVSVPVGLAQQLVATGTFSDGSVSDVSELATWTSADPSVAAVSNAGGSRGRTAALSQGTTAVAAELSGHSAAVTVHVVAAVVTAVAVTPPVATLPRGLTVPLTATSTWSDGSTRDSTAAATWTSADPARASVSNAIGSQGMAHALDTGDVEVTATVNGVGGSAVLTVTAAELVSVGVSPATPSVPAGFTQQFLATGVYTDGTTQDLTGVVAWASSDGSVALVSNAAGSEGLVVALTQGSATVSIALGTFTGSAQLTVTTAVLRAIQLTPSSSSLAAGLSRQLTATGIYSDASTQDVTASVTWSSSDGSIAQLSNAAGSEGQATAVRTGQVIVSARQGAITGTTPLTVTPALVVELQVTPSNASTPRGVGVQLTATGLFSDGTRQDLTSQVTWSSVDPLVVAVSNASSSAGRAASLSVGSTAVTASLGQVTGSTPFTVTPAQLVSLAISPAVVAAAPGTVRQLTAIGTYTDGTTQNLTADVGWTVSDPSIAAVSNAAGSHGVATMLAMGTATVGAQLGPLSATCELDVILVHLTSIELSPANGSTALGYARQFIAIGTYSDGSTQLLGSQVTWASSDPTRAIISNASGSRGLMSTVATGAVSISATAEGVTAATSHTVTAAALVSLTITPASVTIDAGSSVQLTATGAFSDGSAQDLTTTVSWVTGAGSVAQVSNALGSQGLVMGIGSGATTVTATFGTRSAVAQVSVP